MLRVSSLLLALGVASLPAQEAPRPNIVVFLADDLGWSDFGCYGGEIPTPNIDALAANGLRLTQFYNTGRCCPTRASLLTGLYQHQAGIGQMTGDGGHPGYRGELNDECRTIAEVLGSAGYRTWMAGKWHVTGQTGYWSGGENRSVADFPRARGFERFFGTITGAGSYWQPITLMHDDTPVEPFPDALPDDFYYTTAIGEEAARFVNEHESAAPFLLYVAFTAPHWPLHAPEETIAAQRGRYAAGWDALRTARHARQVELGLVDPSWQVTPRDPRVPAWEDAEHREWEQRRMEVYAAQVVELDREVGRVVDALRDRGELDETLIFVLADNGGCAEVLSDWGGIYFPKTTRDGQPVPIGNDPGLMPGDDHSYQSYGIGWANASNTPFRLYKSFNHEGGIASPCILHWPAGIPESQRGGLRTAPAHLVDVMATAVDLAGAEYPEEVDGRAIQPLEGRSLAPLFAPEGALAERSLYFEHYGNRAVRRGRHKLVARGDHGAWELYDMESDRTETQDLAGERPELVEELAADWRAWAERARVVPPDRWRSYSDATEFELGPDAALDRHDAPYAVGKDVEVRIRLAAHGDGVVVAQGGSSHGWSLWIEKGRTAVAVCRAGRRHVVRGGQLPEGCRDLELSILHGGRVEVRADGASLLLGELPGGLVEHPVDGLEVGQDRAGAVGPYRAPNRFTGRIERVLVTVR